MHCSTHSGCRETQQGCSARPRPLVDGKAGGQPGWHTGRGRPLLHVGPVQIPTCSNPPANNITDDWCMQYNGILVSSCVESRLKQREYRTLEETGAVRGWHYAALSNIVLRVLELLHTTSGRQCCAVDAQGPTSPTCLSLQSYITKRADRRAEQTDKTLPGLLICQGNSGRAYMGRQSRLP